MKKFNQSVNKSIDIQSSTNLKNLIKINLLGFLVAYYFGNYRWLIEYDKYITKFKSIYR